jgi:hypothetical protein
MPTSPKIQIAESRGMKESLNRVSNYFRELSKGFEGHERLSKYLLM